MTICTKNWCVAAYPLFLLPDTVQHLERKYHEYFSLSFPNRQYDSIKTAFRHLNGLFPGISIQEFDDECLLVLQRYFVAKGYARSYANRLLNNIKAVFEWGVRKKENGKRLVALETVECLKYVEPLKKGQTNAYEPAARQEVSDVVVGATLHFFAESDRGNGGVAAFGEFAAARCL